MINRLRLPILIVLTLILAGREATGAPMTKSAPTLPRVETYEQLITAIRQTRAESRQRIEALVEAEKVREAWEIGKLIDAHILQHKPRANYDEQVIERLAEDLESSPTEIRYMLRFSRAYPIQPPAAELSWAHYRELLSVNDSKEREEIAEQARQQHWGRDRVREEVRRRRASGTLAAQKESARVILTAAPGKPGMYRVVKAYDGKQPNQLVLDLGFSSYLSLESFSSFKEGDIVAIVGAPLVGARQKGLAHSGAVPRSGASLRRQGQPLRIVNDAVESDLFTYRVHVLQIIDGDTFTAAVQLGFGFTTVQTLRLRAIDAPEIESAAGREAKEFLEKILPRGSDILIRTRRSDKYDRYLADVFVNGEYVNQKLVEEGFAVPLGNWVGE